MFTESFDGASRIEELRNSPGGPLLELFAEELLYAGYCLAIRAYLVKVFHREFYKPCSVTHITYHVPSISPGRPKRVIYNHRLNATLF